MGCKVNENGLKRCMLSSPLYLSLSLYIYSDDDSWNIPFIFVSCFFLAAECEIVAQAPLKLIQNGFFFHHYKDGWYSIIAGKWYLENDRSLRRCSYEVSQPGSRAGLAHTYYLSTFFLRLYKRAGWFTGQDLGSSNQDLSKASLLFHVNKQTFYEETRHGPSG